MKTKDEAFKQIDKATDRIEEGATYGMMTYEEGVKIALEWFLDLSDQIPFDEDE